MRTAKRKQTEQHKREMAIRKLRRARRTDTLKATREAEAKKVKEKEDVSGD